MITNERIQQLADAVMDVAGVRAVVLGGSRARGTHHAGSDVDLGIYYDHTALNVAALADLTAEFHQTGRVDVAGPGQWGPWVNGGAWLAVDGTAVDWILRDAARVEEQCQRARRGEFAFHPQPGHPLGFLDVSYAGEIATCRPLADPGGLISKLQASVRPYPEALRAAMLHNLWQAEFLTVAARKGLPKNDLVYVSQCCSTALMLCGHAWHAAAGVWVLNEKGVVPDTRRLPRDTSRFAERASRAIATLATDSASGIDLVEELVREAQSDAT